MRKLILIPLLILAINACKNDSTIEIIPDYNAEFLSKNELTRIPELLGDKNVSKDLINIIEKATSVKDKEIYYFFNATLYVNEEGQIKKIQYKTLNDKLKNDEAIVNPNIEKIYKKITHYFESIYFTPGSYNGKPTPSRLDIEGSFKVNKEGKADYYLNLDLGGLFKRTEINEDDYFMSVEEMPSPIGGLRKIMENIKYPEQARRDGIQGRVFINALIDEDGTVAKAILMKGIGSGCDEEAIKAVEKTKFIPGKQRGKNVKVRVTVPIVFRLQ